METAKVRVNIPIFVVNKIKTISEFYEHVKGVLRCDHCEKFGNIFTYLFM